MNQLKILHFEVQNIFHTKSLIDLTLALKVTPFNPNFCLKYTSETISRLVWPFVVKANPTLTHYLKLSVISNNYRIPSPIHLLNDFLTVFPRDSSPAAHHFCFEALQPKDKFNNHLCNWQPHLSSEFHHVNHVQGTPVCPCTYLCFQGQWFADTWPPTCTPETFSLLLWFIKAMCSCHDNSTAAHCINQRPIKFCRLNARQLIWLSACNQFNIKAEYITGFKNQIVQGGACSLKSEKFAKSCLHKDRPHLTRK